MEEIRIGIAGLGKRGLHWARVLQDMWGYRITALCEPIAPLLDQAAAMLAKPQDIRTYKCYEDLLGDRQVDAVGLCVRRQDQGAMAARALEAGKHAHSEVPAAHTTEDCWRIVIAAEKTGLVYHLGEQTRYWGFVEAWKDLVGHGARLGYRFKGS